MSFGNPTIKVGGTGGSQYELRVTQTLNANIESVRGRLSAALKRLGYDVLSEEPALEARRGARGWATWGGSSGVLESSVALTIWLRADSDQVTHAIFDYKSWADPTYKSGDMGILASEARAIAALAVAHSAATVCTACGAEERDESRFCRHCGTPKTPSKEPAELEVLRLMAETRAGQIPFKFASALLMISCVLTLIAATLAFAVGAPVFKALLVMMFIGGGFGWLSLILAQLGMRRLRRALTPDGAAPRAILPGAVQQQISTSALERPGLLPGQASPPSVTEGTTEIFVPDSKDRVTAPGQIERRESQ